jgi:hypothetical protein
LIWARCAHAQLGQDEAVCRQNWGVPISTNDVSVDSRCLTYHGPDSLLVKLFFIDGLVRRAVYEKQGMTYSDVRQLLNLNVQDRQWDPLILPGMTPPPTGDRQWMRSDEMGMAVQSSNQLTVIAAEWNRPRPMEGSAAAPNHPLESTNGISKSSPPSADVGATMTKGKTEVPVAIRTPLPAHLPARGALRSEALEMLGPPSGTIMAGAKEVLVYSWGNIWLTDGRVTVVE